MNAYLGLNILHDTSAALVVDGRLVAAVEEERFNRDRHTTAFPVESIKYCLKRAGIRSDDVEAVGVSFNYPEFVNNENPFEEDTIAHLDVDDAGRRRIVERNAEVWLKCKQDIERLSELGLPAPRFLRHHLTHAACGYFLSGWEAAGVLVFDGRGERESTSIWKAIGSKIEVLESYEVNDSLGHLYTYVTHLCGLYSKIGNEGKTMGLSGYGVPGRIDFSGILNIGETRYHIDRAKMRELSGYAVPIGQVDTVARDLAFGVQRELERAYEFLTRRTVSLTGFRSIVLSGGIALNCNANGVLVQSGIVDRVYIPPAANDAGTSIGAAFLLWVEATGLSPTPPTDPVYLGESVDQVSSGLAVEDAAKGSNFGYKEIADATTVAAAAIASGLIVGWCQGEMEFGPRALGNRSILADPRDPTIPDKLNARVKFRESWRPFAPSVLEEHSADWFSPDVRSPHMLLSLNVLEGRRGAVPAITHVDGTARVQAVTSDANPLFYSLIEAFRARTGVPLVLNTSLNIRGEPIARTAHDAVRCFLESGLDVLFVNQWCLWKPDAAGSWLDAVGGASVTS